MFEGAHDPIFGIFLTLIGALLLATTLWKLSMAAWWHRGASMPAHIPIWSFSAPGFRLLLGGLCLVYGVGYYLVPALHNWADLFIAPLMLVGIIWAIRR